MQRSPRCKVCDHPDRAAIETAILAGKSQRAIARDFGLSDHKIVGRHVDRCMPDAYQAAMAESKVQHGVAVAARLRFLDEVVDEVLREAREGDPITSADGTPFLDSEGRPIKTKNHRVILAAVREGRANADLLAKLSGQVAEDDEAGVEQARQAQQDPEVRRMLAQVEAHLTATENRTD